MSVLHNGACWLAVCDPEHGRSLAETLDAANLGFVMAESPHGSTLILANHPLNGAHVQAIGPAEVDAMGAVLLRDYGGSMCGCWAEEPPEPWASEFGQSDECR